MSIVCVSPFNMKQHDNHVAAYYFRKSALADKAKSDRYERELIRRAC
jgi:hypothetical protein